MGFLGVSLTFIGYVLVYASVANHGRFYANPWAGVLHDAYDGPTPWLDAIAAAAVKSAGSAIQKGTP